MRILCSNQALLSRGGSESYLETIAPELRRLGHRVDFYSQHLGPFADQLRSQGFAVFSDLDMLDRDYDVIHAQHATTAYALRAEFPTTPMVFASHSWFLEIEDPPQEIGIAGIIAFNETVAERLRASNLAELAPVHRLTQPVHISGFESNRAPIREVPLQAVVVSRRLRKRLPELRDACDALGIELRMVGLGNEVADPTAEVMQADIVIGAGRSALEGMALARAVFIYEESGCAGWVDENSYPHLERTGFTPTPGNPVENLKAELGTYSAALGPMSRELAIRHHDASRHAATLVEIYRSVTHAPIRTTNAIDLDARAFLTERVYGLEERARNAEWELVHQRHELARVRTELEHRARAAEAEVDALHRSLSWRITRPLRLLGRALRRKS